MKKLIIIVTLALVALVGQADVVINEVMADNGGKYPNAAGEAMDWVELYNPSETPVDLTGWRITDTVEDKWSKWKEIPAGTTVPAQGYLLLWGHNKDFPIPEDEKGFCGVTNGEVHVKLGLSSKGETITLAASEANYNAKAFADQVTFGAQFADVSYGRDPSDTAKWLFFTNATPGAANGSDGLAKYPPDEEQGGEEPGSGDDEDIDGPHEGEFAIVLDVSRPVADKAMKATVTGERTGNVVFAWSLRKPTGEYGDTVCEDREYTPTAADYEHWVRVVAKDEAGKEVSKQFYFSKLPIVYIDTDDGQPVTVKTEYKDATIRIQGNDLYDQQYEGTAEIKGRGNATWTYPKKPYKLKLGSKANLFGFGKNKHWVLLANYNDASLLRSSLAHDVAVQAGVLAMDLTWVDVVFNGEFIGNYQVCEHVRIDPNRVNIFDWESLAEDVADVLFTVAKDIEGFSKSDKSGLETAMSEDLSWVTTGEVNYKEKKIPLSTYESAILSNSDFIASYGEKESLNFDLSGGCVFGMSEPQGDNADVTNFKTKQGMHINVSKPEFLLTNGKMMEFATNLWNEFEASYMAEDGYSVEGRHMSEIADIDVMAGYWLVMEITANLDSVTHSRYSYLDVGSKLQMGPVWDFDFSAGCAYNVKNPQRWYLGNLGKVGTSKYLYGNWVNDPYFCLKAYEKYWQIRKHLDDEILEDGRLDEYGRYLCESGVVNSELWPVPVSETQPTPLDFEHDVAYVKSYMKTRLEWLDKQFLSIDNLLRSLANLYVKDDATLVLSLVNGMDAADVNAATDFVLGLGEKAPQVRVAVSNGAIVKLHAYVNGLKYGIYDVADGKCEFTVLADKIVAEPGRRDMVSLIAKDADGKTIARNYLTILNPPIPPVTVTEIMADNGGSYTNADGNSSDWIELHNAGATDADISGWRLCDSTTKKWGKWEELPEGTIVPAGGHLIVWADDFTGWTNGEVHVNLGFSSKGEEVALAIAEGEIVSSFAFGPQHTDVSFGRAPSDPEKLVYFRTPTPGAANGNDGIENGDSFNISINELMAENGGKFPNAAGEAMDWVELYNAGAADVDVSGWGFQDDPAKAWSKWKTLPEGAVVPAGGYLLVWGDNKDFNSFTGITNGEVHVNMGLSKKGEGLHLALTNGVGTVVRIDGFDFPKQAPDVSWGRTASDPDKFIYFTEPTPAAANGDAGREALVFTIDFDSNGGSSVASVTNDYGAAISAPETPARTGYAFAGWYESGAADPFVFSTMPARDVALTVRWTANAYTVVYDPNGGEGASVTNAATYDASFDVAGCGFSRTGYAFAGWTTNLAVAAEFAPGAAVSNLTAEAGAMVTLYATWETNAYTLVYAADNGTGASVSTNLTYDAEHVVLTNPFAKAGHSFVSWTNEAGVAYLPGQTVTNLAAEAGATVVWTAAWTANVYAVSFDSNGGSAVDPLVADYGAAISAPEAPVRTGYAFAGWYESDAAEPFVFSTMPARDVALTARWTANEYTVVYDPNGGEGASVTNGATYDAPFEVGSCGFARTGYAFAGWTTNLDAAAEFAPGAAVSNLTASANGDVTMYATWEANEYTLVYAADNGTDASVETNLAYDAEHVVVANPFAKAGHSFVSWTNEAGVAYLPGQTVTNLAAEAGATVVWTAAWTANVYVVSFDPNGGTAVDPLVADYDAAISAPETPARTGYAFAGWYESGAAEPFVFSTMPARDVALAARWTANEYTVVYDANGGAGAMEPMDFTYDVEKPLASNAYSKVGYTFAGWAREAATGMSPPRLADGEVVSNLTAEAGATVTLYAVWERVGVAAGETKTVVDEVTGEEKTVVVLPETEPEFTGEAAAVYDGFVMSAAGEVVGTVQVKAAKANKKSGISTLTATVQIVGEKKLSFKGGEWGPGSEYAEMALKDGRVLTVAIGANGLVGTFGEYEINGSANIFSSKDKETKAFVKAIEDAWVGAVNVVGDGVVLSVAIAKKGKVKVSGTVDGAKVSATSQLLVGADVCCIPVVIAKKAKLAFNLWLNADGSVEIAGLDGAAAGKAGTLKSGAAFRMDGAALAEALPGLLTDYLPDGLAVGLNKTKWVVAPDEKGKAAKAGKVAINKKTGGIDETKLGANPAALKLTYTAKSGSFKGSFKAYTLDAKGKIKSYTVNVTGVMVGDVGYGTATLKKPAYTLVVAIE